MAYPASPRTPPRTPTAKRPDQPLTPGSVKKKEKSQNIACCYFCHFDVTLNRSLGLSNRYLRLQKLRAGIQKNIKAPLGYAVAESSWEAFLEPIVLRNESVSGSVLNIPSWIGSELMWRMESADMAQPRNISLNRLLVSIPDYSAEPFFLLFFEKEGEDDFSLAHSGCLLGKITERKVTFENNVLLLGGVEYFSVLIYPL